MAIKVVMPQMGESITEGTIVRWFKEIGDKVNKDEPLLEISTDKVDAEVPSPASGTLARIHHQPGDTVAVETVIAEIADAGEGVSADAAPAQAEAPAATAPAEPAAEPAPESAPKPTPQPAPRTAEPAPTAASDDSEAAALRKRSSPLVRKIADEHGVDVSQVTGTGIHGRVTKDDILAYVEGGKGTSRPPAQAPAAPAAAPRPAAPPTPVPARPVIPFSGDEHREKMTIMRQRIAEHMVASRRTSPHVNTVFEVDMTRVVTLRERSKAAFEAQHGLKLTYTPFFLAAVVEGLQSHPMLNASVDGDEVVYHRHANLGVAVALEQGLIVPVIRNAEEKSLVGLQRAISDLANRARTKQLKPEEVGGSTFSITNPGPYGGLYGLPIINQPNVAILSTGGIHRRPLVVTDDEGREAIAIRDVVYLALSFDHRLVDGATADKFMAHVKAVLEVGQFDLR